MTNLNDAITDRIIEVMNRMLESDPRATNAILRTRHNCNQRLADDPTIQVASDWEPPTVGLLGILNGLAGVLPKESEKPGWGRVAAVYNLLCPVHGEGLEANDKSRIEDPCLILDCGATLELGSLVRFERTEQDPLALKSATIPVIPDAVQVVFPNKETVVFGLPSGYDRLTTAIHMECMRPVFREPDGSRVRTEDDCKCHDGEKS